jgi:hypothetical protein
MTDNILLILEEIKKINNKLDKLENKFNNNTKINIEDNLKKIDWNNVHNY